MILHSYWDETYGEYVYRIRLFARPNRWKSAAVFSWDAIVPIGHSAYYGTAMRYLLNTEHSSDCSCIRLVEDESSLIFRNRFTESDHAVVAMYHVGDGNETLMLFLAETGCAHKIEIQL